MCFCPDLRRLRSRVDLEFGVSHCECTRVVPGQSERRAVWAYDAARMSDGERHSLLLVQPSKLASSKPGCAGSEIDFPIARCLG